MYYNTLCTIEYVGLWVALLNDVLGFSRRGFSFLAPFAVGFPVFAAMATVFFYPRVFAGSVGGRVLLVVPVDTLYRTLVVSSSAVLPLGPFVDLSLAPLSLCSRSVVRALGCGSAVGSPRSSSAPPSLGRGRVVPPRSRNKGEFTQYPQCAFSFFFSVRKTHTLFSTETD